MGHIDGHVAVWAIALIQGVGLISAFFARASVGSRRQNSCQWLCLACLALVGGTNLLAATTLTPLAWMVSSVTLAVMVVAAVWDAGPKELTAV